MVFYWIERFKMSVKFLITTGPRCFKCLYEMPSGSIAEIGFVFSIACLVVFGAKVGGGLFCWRCLRWLSLFCCQWGRVVVWRWMHSVCGVGLTVVWGRGFCSYLWWWLRVCLYMYCWAFVWGCRVWRNWFCMRWCWEVICILSVVRVGYHRVFLCYLSGLPKDIYCYSLQNSFSSDWAEIFFLYVCRLSV